MPSFEGTSFKGTPKGNHHGGSSGVITASPLTPSPPHPLTPSPGLPQEAAFSVVSPAPSSPRYRPNTPRQRSSGRACPLSSGVRVSQRKMANVCRAVENQGNPRKTVRVVEKKKGSNSGEVRSFIPGFMHTNWCDADLVCTGGF